MPMAFARVRIVGQESGWHGNSRPSQRMTDPGVFLSPGGRGSVFSRLGYRVPTGAIAAGEWMIDYIPGCSFVSLISYIKKRLTPPRRISRTLPSLHAPLEALFRFTGGAGSEDPARIRGFRLRSSAS